MRRRLAALLMGLAAASLMDAGVRAQTAPEYAVKAAYLVKFTPFIDWPDSAFAAPNAPLTICVMGNDPFGADLDHEAAGQRDGEHPIQIRRLAQPDPGCHILFVDGDGAETALEAVKDKPVVTVTDSGAHAHGMISFILVDNHVRFDIDEAAAGAVGVKISSKLLDLAHAVRRSKP
jgi:hypothetical protein